MKYLSLVMLIVLLGGRSFANSSSECRAYYSGPKSFTISFHKSEVFELPSGRKVLTHFEKSKDLKLGDEIFVTVLGLGKEFGDLSTFTEAALAHNKSVFSIDLHGHSESNRLNPELANKMVIPHKYNTEDLFFIFKELSKRYKIKPVAHSYGGGIVLDVLSRIEAAKLSLPISDVILLGPLVKNLDKYYSDAVLSGQLPQVSMDLSNPFLNQLGIPAAFINSGDVFVNNLLFNSNAIPQKIRDTMMGLNPFYTMMIEIMSSVPNNMANIFMGPQHMIANANYKQISEWQKNPMLLAQLVKNNMAIVNGSRELNFLDYSKPLRFPKNINYKVVMALNDSVVPNTINQEFVARLKKAGYHVESQMIPGETHYFLYGESIKSLFNDIFM